LSQMVPVPEPGAASLVFGAGAVLGVLRLRRSA
jgi:hypothetical protein